MQYNSISIAEQNLTMQSPHDRYMVRTAPYASSCIHGAESKPIEIQSSSLQYFSAPQSDISQPQCNPGW